MHCEAKMTLTLSNRTRRCAVDSAHATRRYLTSTSTRTLSSRTRLKSPPPIDAPSLKTMALCTDKDPRRVPPASVPRVAHLEVFHRRLPNAAFPVTSIDITTMALGARTCRLYRARHTKLKTRRLHRRKAGDRPRHSTRASIASRLRKRRRWGVVRGKASTCARRMPTRFPAPGASPRRSSPAACPHPKASMLQRSALHTRRVR